MVRLLEVEKSKGSQRSLIKITSRELPQFALKQQHSDLQHLSIISEFIRIFDEYIDDVTKWTFCLSNDTQEHLLRSYRRLKELNQDNDSIVSTNVLAMLDDVLDSLMDELLHHLEDSFVSFRQTKVTTIHQLHVFCVLSVVAN